MSGGQKMACPSSPVVPHPPAIPFATFCFKPHLCWTNWFLSFKGVEGNISYTKTCSEFQNSS